MKRLAGAVAALYSLLAAAQTEIPVFRADTNLQSIAVRVTDKRGELVQGLTASDFTLLENGRPRKIAFFGAEFQPVSLALAIDVSHSMESGGKLEQAGRLIAPLLRDSRAEDEVLFLPFDDGAAPAQRLTPEQRSRPPALAARPGGSGGTALYDALASSLCQMRTAQHLRQAVVVVTDGADQHSRLRLEQLIELARSSSAQVFAIGLYSKAEREAFGREKTVRLASGRAIDNPLLVFERLAAESGAESFFPTSEQEFRKALDRIAAVLEGQYTLAYYPEDAARLRRIEVKVRRGAARVSARRTVGSDPGGEPVRFAATGCAVSAADHPFPWESRAARKPSGAMIYHEDFANPGSGWPVRREDSVRSGYAAGGYELSRSPRARETQPRAADGAVAAYGPWWGDFEASALVDANWRRGARSDNLSDSAAGMLFRVSAQGFYALMLSQGVIPGDEEKRALAYTLVRSDWSGRRSELIPWTFLDHDAPEPGGYRVSVQCRRGRIAVSVNGREVNRAEDDAIEAV